MKQLIVFAAFVFLFASCKRDIVFGIISSTEPSLVVVVETKTVSGSATTYTKISGAEVYLYNNEADFEANAIPLKLKITGPEGKAVFSKSDLLQKGVFYVKTTSGTISGSGITPYLLLNDGETFFHLELCH
jgi:hypothetical protein